MSNELKHLSNYIPEIKLSYEKLFHNKVYNIEYYVSIPYGKKYLAWFKHFYGKNNLYLLEINKKKYIQYNYQKNSNNHRNNQRNNHRNNNRNNNRNNHRTNYNINDIQPKTFINKIIKYSACFKDHLCVGNGTMFYGTIVKYKNHDFFNIEDIIYNKGQSCFNLTNVNKLEIIHTILAKSLRQEVFTKNSMVFGVPLMTNDKSKIPDLIYNSPYKIYSIQHRFLTKKINTFYNQSIDNFKIFANFIVKADINPDTYNIYALHNHKRIYHGILLISSYKTSVKMNKIFRKIKENINLDYLEESSDEEDFENINEDKFVNLHIEKIFKCEYSRKFKLWIPIEETKNRVSDLIDVKKIEN